MSEETPKISEEKIEEPVTPKITATKKEKDPKRVEAGRRLAAISKAAKERKMREKIVSERKQDNGSGEIRINYGVLEVMHYLKYRKQTSRRFERRPFVRRSCY